jgi:hypothetical protein
MDFTHITQAANLTLTGVNPYRFLSVNIPGNISLDQSFYSNPTSLFSGAFIKLNLWYCTWANLQELEKKGFISPAKTTK